MPIQLSSNFDLSARLPLDNRRTKTSLATRNAIPENKRYDGMKVFVTDTGKDYQLIGGVTDLHWFEVGVTPQSSIFEWKDYKYQPYVVATTGSFDSGTVNPTGTTRLNYSGYLYAARLFDNGTRVSIDGHTHTDTYEPILGNPSASNNLLVSTTGGVRSWATIASLLPKATTGSLGVIRVGSYLTIDENGVLNGQAGGTGGGGAWGTITGTISSQVDLSDALALKAPLISPSFTTPALGTPSAGTLTNCTFPTLNQSTTGSAGSLVTADFSLVQESGMIKLKYGSLVILTISNTGAISSANEETAFATIS